ncbi:MAG TPA: ferrous iron transporter B [Marmoricola sp.]|nr:ferrous iron transporter B [Marmoricola sp.]
MSERRITSPLVPSCHAVSVSDGEEGLPVVALAGAPNVGKSTLFNALSGARHVAGNWPGTTVEVVRGLWRTRHDAGPDLALIDLPGTYSLDPDSPDEQLARTLLLEEPEEDRPAVVVVAVDAAHLSRSLYFVAQLREQPYRVVVALTMTDVARRRGVHVDTDALSRALGVPVVEVNPRQRAGTTALAVAVLRVLDGPVQSARPVATTAGDELEAADERFAWVLAAVDRAASHPPEPRRTWSDRVDRWAMSPVTGPVLFLATMFLVFQATTSLVAPLQDALGRLLSGPVADGLTTVLGWVGLEHTWVRGFMVDGLLAGVGMLLTFVPLMAVMFVLLAILEDSGYMARAAVVTSRAMRFIGLPAKAFLPLIVGYGCNVPAIMATRVLPDARQRVLTALLVPFTSCSARLTVYVLIGTTFFPAHAGLVVFAMYVVSIALVVLVGLLLRSTLWQRIGDTPLMLDLPAYQRPALSLLTQSTWVRLKDFLRTAGGIIVATVSVLWLLQAIPVHGDARFGDVPADDSLYAAAAQTAAPVFGPAGFGRWEVSSALVVGFVAKEAVISSWAQTYAATDGVSTPKQLSAELRSDVSHASGGHPSAAAWAFLVFLLAYTPCLATLTTQRREIGLRWTLFGLALQLTVAWSLAVAVFQVGRLLT